MLKTKTLTCDEYRLNGPGYILSLGMRLSSEYVDKTVKNCTDGPRKLIEMN